MPFSAAPANYQYCPPTYGQCTLTLHLPPIAIYPQRPKLVLLRPTRTNEYESERKLLLRHKLRTQGCRQLLRKRLRRRHRVPYPDLLLLVPLLRVRAELAAQRPDAPFYAFFAEIAGQRLGVLEEIVVDELSDFPFGLFVEVLAVERFAGDAVDVLNVVVRNALVEDLSPYSTGRAGEDDLHLVCVTVVLGCRLMDDPVSCYQVVFK